MKSRWFNYRPLCIVFLFLLLGSIFSYFITKQLTFTIIISVIILILFIVLTIIKKKIKFLLIPLVSFIVGAGLYNIAIYSFDNGVAEKPSSIQARVYNLSKPEDGSIRLHADSCKFNGENINENIIIYVYDNSNLFENLEIGSIIEFTPSNFYKTDLFYYGTPNASYYSKNLKYSATVSYSNIEFLSFDRTLAEKIKAKIKENLAYGLTNENVEIAYSALFGDTDLLSDNQYNAYKLSGVAHLLAVSGLNVAIIVTIVYKILDWFHIKRWYKLAVVLIFILAYMYLCNFSVSIVRATIMYIMLLLAPLFYREYDPLSSIALAGIIIFLFNPLSAFDISFLMSFSCVAGITMLYKPIKTALSHTKLPNSIANSLAVSCATMLTLIFIMAHYFNTLNIISLLSNIILIPIFTFAFVILFVVSLLSLIIPVITYLLLPINQIFNAINIIATILGGLTISNFTTIQFSYIAIVLYFILLLLISRICTAKKEIKVMLSLPTVALLIVCLV